MENDACGGQMPDWLAARAGLSPTRLALRASGEQLTFRELDRRASSVARRLAGLGVCAGDRVALLLRSGVPTVELVHGAGRIGAVLVPLNVRLAPAELVWQVANIRPRLLLYDEANREAAEEAAHALNAPHSPAGVCNTPLRSRGEGEYAVSPLPRTAIGVGGEGSFLALNMEQCAALPEVNVPLRERIDLAAVHTIVYTSGTTGRPKGAMLTYGNHWWSAMGSALNLGLRDDDRWLAPLPLFHVGGLAILMRSVIYGIPALVHDGFDPAAVNRAIDEDGVTIVSVVSSMLRRMLDARAGRPYPPTLRHVLLGGGPVPLPLLEECRRRGVPVVQTYGLTETASQAATLPPEDALRKPGSAGKPLLPTELRIERDGRPVPPGEAGEIVVRGPTVTPGYADRPEETARALRGGWLHTGDIGRLDDDGYLYVLDRRSDLIVSGGENVYPAEIEAVLAAHPAVAEAGVAGQDDARWGRVPVAFVVLRPGASATPDELIAFCGERLARYKVPARVHVVDALPRNAAGKLLRHKLVPPSYPAP
jgi:o-succinylbenzoate---CoA ligase